MPKNKQKPERHAAVNCSCDKCWKPKPADEKEAAAWWQALYARHDWPKDDLGYLKG